MLKPVLQKSQSQNAGVKKINPTQKVLGQILGEQQVKQAHLEASQITIHTVVLG